MAHKSRKTWLDGVHVLGVRTVKTREVVVQQPLRGVRLEQHEAAYEDLQLYLDFPRYLLARALPDGRIAVLDRCSTPFTPTPEDLDLLVLSLDNAAASALCLT